MMYLRIGVIRENPATKTKTYILLIRRYTDIFFILNDGVSIKIDPQLINEYKTKW